MKYFVLLPSSRQLRQKWLRRNRQLESLHIDSLNFISLISQFSPSIRTYIEFSKAENNRQAFFSLSSSFLPQLPLFAKLSCIIKIQRRLQQNQMCLLLFSLRRFMSVILLLNDYAAPSRNISEVYSEERLNYSSHIKS